MKTLQKLVITSVLMLIQVSLFADQEPTHLLLKLTAKKDGVKDFFYIYYSSPYGDEDFVKSNYISLKINPKCENINELKKYFHPEINEIDIPRLLYATKKIEKIDKITFQFGKREFIDLTKFTSVKLESILESGFQNDFRMLENETYNMLTTQKVVSFFEIILDSDEFGSSFLVVVSFNDLWSDDFFLTQLYGFQLNSNFKSQYNSNQLMDTWEKSVEYSHYYENRLKRKLPQIIGSNRQGEDIVLKKRLPKTIQKAIQEKKILVFPDYEL